MKNIHILITALILFIAHLGFAQLPNIGLELKNASVSTQGNVLTISTGKAEGKWQWTGNGFVSIGFKNLEDGREWATKDARHLADWDLRIFDGKPELKSLKADVSTDEDFTSEHIRIVAEMEYPMAVEQYPSSKLGVRFEIWAYPDAPGFRTQLFVQGKGQWVGPGIASSDDYRADYLPMSFEGLARQSIGFYNNHDGRNSDNQDFVDNDLIDSEFSGNETYEKASILFMYDKDGGVGFVKESHKVVNKTGVNTGVFRSNKNGLESTGWGLSLADIRRGEYSPCWANWRICWSGGEDEKQLAIKMFDRIRFPIKKEDVVITTNVWGGGQGSAGAKESNIIKEINSCADLGIDVVQIDAGWSDRDRTSETWEPSLKQYPTGWDNIMNLAKEKDVKMGIWNTCESINKYPDRLIGLNDAGFLYYKVDISSWNTYRIINEITNNVRNMGLHSNHKARINWDVTHKGLRVGYLFNREYGNLFLQNRRLDMERNMDENEAGNHTYFPRRILKDQWSFAPYLNLNQIMINVQTTEFVRFSNARQYGDVYSFAITMMSAPLFFTETWRYSQKDRDAVRELISVYKKYREDLYNGYAFSIGDRPDDTSWTGFQNYHPDENIGYLTLFREIDNKDKKKKIQLHFIKGKTLAIEDLITGKKKNYQVDNNGFVEFTMETPAS
ncbi:MAG: alpha-galactosidase, partial [Bacteroidales bacterium]|nr:alpha-galactosidase [Bacteroidales bacterium]